MRFSREIKRLIKTAKISNFPVRLSEIKQIIERSGWEIYSYSEAVDIIEQYQLQEMVEKNDSFATRIGNKIVIIYDDNISQLDFPYILAHEIGHIVLGHLDSIDNTDDIYTKERDCNCFANELLGYIPNHKIGIVCGIGAITTLILTIIVVLFNNTYSITQNPPLDTSLNITISIDENVLSEHIITESTPVYITQYGEKFHLEGCRYIENKDNLIKVSIAEAVKAGYEHCEICFDDYDDNTE